MKTLLHILIPLLFFSCYGKLFSQDNYYIIADSSEDSLFCAKYCPFYDFDSKTSIIGSTLPEQMVSIPGDNMIQLLKSAQIVLESTFGYNQTGLPLVLYVVVDNSGIARGVIVNTANHQSKRSQYAARVAYDYLKTKEYIPASLRGKPITYYFTVLAKIEEKEINYDEFEIINALTSWPVYQNEQSYRELDAFVKENLHYEDTITTTKSVRVRFLVDTLGNTHLHEIVHSESPLLNDEALRVCQLINFTKPAMQRDRPVSVWLQVPVKFEPKQVVKTKQKQCFFKRRK